MHSATETVGGMVQMKGKVDSAAGVGLCCMHNAPVRCLLGFLFRKFAGNAEALHRVSKNVPPLACYNSDTHEWILISLWQKCYR